MVLLLNDTGVVFLSAVVISALVSVVFGGVSMVLTTVTAPLGPVTV